MFNNQKLDISKPVSSEGLPQKRKSIDISNKTFFTNIKAELNNIRTDVNKLVNKDSAPKWNGMNKSAYQYEPVNEKMRLEKKTLDQNSHPQADPELARKFSEELKELHSKFEQQNIQMKNMEGQLCQKIQENEWLRRKIEEVTNESQNKDKSISKLQRQCQRNVQSFGTENQSQIKKIKSLQSEIQTKIYELRAMNELNQRLQRTMGQMKESHAQEVKKIKEMSIQNIEKNKEKESSSSYQQLGSDFEKKINDLIDENYALKNKLANEESQNETLKIKIQSLEETVDAYEKRSEELGSSALEVETENLRNKISELKEQNDKMHSDHEFEIMKLENMIDELKQSGRDRSSQNKPINQILKDQIIEIQNLREKLREKNDIISRMKK